MARGVRRSGVAKKEEALTILNAVIQFRSNHGGSIPTETTIGPLFDAVKDSLRKGITSAQLYNKFRVLKKHYRKARVSGVGPTQFDRCFFDLSVKAWDQKRPREIEATKSNKKSSKIAENADTQEEEEEEEDAGRDPFRYLTDHVMKCWEMYKFPLPTLEFGLEFMDKKKAMVFEDEWRKDLLREIRIKLEDTKLKKDTCTALAAAVGKNASL